jgi:hypothetical protein
MYPSARTRTVRSRAGAAKHDECREQKYDGGQRARDTKRRRRLTVFCRPKRPAPTALVGPVATERPPCTPVPWLLPTRRAERRRRTTHGPLRPAARRRHTAAESFPRPLRRPHRPAERSTGVSRVDREAEHRYAPTGSALACEVGRNRGACSVLSRSVGRRSLAHGRLRDRRDRADRRRGRLAHGRSARSERARRCAREPGASRSSVATGCRRRHPWPLSRLPPAADRDRRRGV